MFSLDVKEALASLLKCINLAIVILAMASASAKSGIKVLGRPKASSPAYLNGVGESVEHSGEGADREPDVDVIQNRLQDDSIRAKAELHLRRKIDLRLCTIAGILCSLNLLDSGIISSASVTSMLSDLDLVGNRYSVSIFIFTVASVCFQLPSTILLRLVGPRIFFATITGAFGIITMCTAAITTWKQMIALRVLLGISMSGVFPGLSKSPCLLGLKPSSDHFQHI